MIGRWRPAVNGNGAYPWFLYRDAPRTEDRYHESKAGFLVRYKTMESAQRAANRLNTMKPPLGEIPWLPPRGFEIDGHIVSVVPESASADELREFWIGRGVSGPASIEEYWQASGLAREQITPPAEYVIERGDEPNRNLCAPCAIAAEKAGAVVQPERVEGDGSTPCDGSH